jgi:hypothetical protein
MVITDLPGRWRLNHGAGYEPLRHLDSHDRTEREHVLKTGKRNQRAKYDGDRNSKSGIASDSD